MWEDLNPINWKVWGDIKGVALSLIGRDPVYKDLTEQEMAVIRAREKERIENPMTAGEKADLVWNLLNLSPQEAAVVKAKKQQQEQKEMLSLFGVALLVVLLVIRR